MHFRSNLAIACSLFYLSALTGCSDSSSDSTTQTTSSPTSPATTTPIRLPHLATKRTLTHTHIQPFSPATPPESPKAQNTQQQSTELNVLSLNTSIHHLMDSYTSLRLRVSEIIDQIDNGANNVEVIANSGGQWYNDERGFQSHISDLSTNFKTNPQYLLIKGNLSEAETFLYSAGADAMSSCDPKNARRELEVADYFYRAAKKNMSTGIADPDDVSDPPEVGTSERSCSSP